MTAIEKMVEFLKKEKGLAFSPTAKAAVNYFIEEAERLAQEEKAHKAEAPDSLVDTVYDLAQSRNGDGCDPIWPSELLEIISRYRPVHSPEASTSSEHDEKVNTAPAGLWNEMLALQAGYSHRWPQETVDKFNEVMSRYRPAPSSDEGLREALKEYLNNDCPPIAWYLLTPEEKEYFKGVEAVQKTIAEILSRHPSTKSDRRAELVERLRLYCAGYQAVEDKCWVDDINTICSEFSKDADGKEG